jgi:hypothetical protein
LRFLRFKFAGGHQTGCLGKCLGFGGCGHFGIDHPAHQGDLGWASGYGGILFNLHRDRQQTLFIDRFHADGIKPFPFIVRHRAIDRFRGDGPRCDLCQLRFANHLSRGHVARFSRLPSPQAIEFANHGQRSTQDCERQDHFQQR